MKRNQTLILLAAAVAAAVVYNYLARTISNEGATRSITRSGRPTPTVPATSGLDASALAEIRGHDVARRLDLAVAALKGITNASEARQILSELHVYLLSLPPELASAVIADFLREPSRDATTRIEFSVGKSGFLDGHPSLRVALLDWLGQIHSAQAGVVAKAILASPTQPDEWAVCLRNYARANPTSESFEFLRAKTEELIRNPMWREKPSVGFLEAFDVLVHAQATESTALLSELVVNQTREGKTLAHAAYLTLDRLMIREPVAMMKQLGTRSALTEIRGPMVANIFARADLRDPLQRQLVRDYLLNPNRTVDELAAFVGVYPNANFAISKNLLTEIETPSREEIMAHDVTALATVTAWLEDPAFEPVKPYLTTMHDRLGTFVRAAR